MDYFAGLDISMDETDVCVLDREGVVIHESKTASTAKAIVVALAKAPSCRRIVFETGEWADPVSRLEPTRSPRGLSGESAGLPGAQVARDPQRPTAKEVARETGGGTAVVADPRPSPARSWRVRGLFLCPWRGGGYN